jgi:hypothetical protein
MRRAKGFRKARITGILSLLVVAMTATAAYAASTRAEYVAQVDPICHTAFVSEKAADKTFHRRIKKEEQQIQRGRRSKRGRFAVFHFYHRLRQVNRNMDAAIGPIAPAPGDEGAIQTWLNGSERSIILQARALRALQREPGRYIKLFLKAFDASLSARDTVRDFGFAYCTRVTVFGPIGY